MRRSLTRSLAIRCSILAVLGLFVAIGEHFVRDGVELHYELDALSDELIASVERVGTDHRLNPSEALVAWLERVPDLRLLVVDPDGAVVFAWRTEPGRAPEEDLVYRLSLLSTDGHFAIGDNLSSGARFGYVRTVRAPDGTLLRVTAERAPPQTRDRWYWLWAEINGEYGPFMLVSAALSILVVTLTVGRAMRSLGRISLAAAAIVPGSGAKLDADTVPAEVAPLVEAINGALERLQDALERERRFTADVAHTLRTPLAALRARVEGLAEGPEKTALLAGISRIERVAGQVLLKARLEAGALDERTSFDLGELVREVAANTAPLLRERGQKLLVDVPDVPIPCRGSAVAIEQALLNLVDNAIKASAPAGEVEILARPDGTVLVRDRGPGFVDAEREPVFTPFRRGSTSRWQGAGLGLAIVAEAVRRQGGELVARNRPGGGAEVGFRLVPEPAVQPARKLPA
jgi:signal transduction histidine kinase